MGDEEDLSDLFSDLFGRRSRGGGGYEEFHARGSDLRYHLEVDFLDAARGAKRAVTMPDGKAIEIAVPAGVRDGQTLRLRGKGAPGYGKAPAGDALVTISVKPHPVFTRDGDDIEVELPITLPEYFSLMKQWTQRLDAANHRDLGPAASAEGQGDQAREDRRGPDRPAEDRSAEAGR